MTDITTYRTERYDIYELYHDVQITATSPTITVTGKKPHADVIAATGHKLERTRIYINGVRATITEVALNINDTDITVSDTVVSGDTVDIFLAATVGTLKNNTTSGKLPLVELQVMQGYGATSNTFNQPGCGTERTESLAFAADGMIALGLNRRGNDHMENFISARKNKKYLMIIVVDTTEASDTYDILHEARVASYGRATQAVDAEGGKVTDTITFSFVPDAAVTT